MRNVTPEQVAMAEQHRRGELPDRTASLADGANPAALREVPTLLRAGAFGCLGSCFRPYSPKLVEEEFSEVRAGFGMVASYFYGGKG
jgi:hypothetical protein